MRLWLPPGQGRRDEWGGGRRADFVSSSARAHCEASSVFTSAKVIAGFSARTFGEEAQGARRGSGTREMGRRETLRRSRRSPRLWQGRRWQGPRGRRACFLLSLQNSMNGFLGFFGAFGSRFFRSFGAFPPPSRGSSSPSSASSPSSCSAGTLALVVAPRWLRSRMMRSTRGSFPNAAAAPSSLPDAAAAAAPPSRGKEAGAEATRAGGGGGGALPSFFCFGGFGCGLGMGGTGPTGGRTLLRKAADDVSGGMLGRACGCCPKCPASRLPAPPPASGSGAAGTCLFGGGCQSSAGRGRAAAAAAAPWCASAARGAALGASVLIAGFSL